MRRNSRRWSLTVIVGAVLSIALMGDAMAAGSFSSPEKVPVPGAYAGDKYNANDSWNNGDPTLVVTQQGGQKFLHAVYNSDYTMDTSIWQYNGYFAYDGTDYVLAPYYVRSTDGGGWTSPINLTRQTMYHAERVVLAATSNNTLVASYISQVHYYKGAKYTFKVSEARDIFMIRNPANGDAGSWESPQQQTFGSKFDYPYIAAAASNVYVTATDANSGDIHVWKSTDNGGTWNNDYLVGTTYLNDSELEPNGYVGGYSGLPAIAASGMGGENVLLTWNYSDGASATTPVALVSSDGGATWSDGAGNPRVDRYEGPFYQVADGAEINGIGYSQAAALYNRMVTTWTTASGAYLRTYTAGVGWGSTKTITTFPDMGGLAKTNVEGQGAIVAIAGNNTIGVSLSECNQITNHLGAFDPCTAWLAKTRMSLHYFQSTDGGNNWERAVVAVPTHSGTTFMNEFGSMVFWPTDGNIGSGAAATPYVYWTGHNSKYTRYREWLARGSGWGTIDGAG